MAINNPLLWEQFTFPLAPPTRFQSPPKTRKAPEENFHMGEFDSEKTGFVSTSPYLIFRSDLIFDVQMEVKSAYKSSNTSNSQLRRT
jgi:hypothetical protein